MSVLLKDNSFSGCCSEELWKKDADTGTPGIATRLPGSALFIQLYCTGCVARLPTQKK